LFLNSSNHNEKSNLSVPKKFDYFKSYRIKILIMNPFLHIPIDEGGDEIIIENDNQCRNKKKLLQRKIEKYDKDPSQELFKNIRILKCEIREYETKDVVKEKVSKKESSKSKNDDSKLLNQLSKQNRKLRFKQRMRDQEIDKLWRKSNGYPKLSPKVHKLFPLMIEDV
jgi:hypothetical protein